MEPCMERETGFEPATPSLEGWRSTPELFPPEIHADGMVARGGFEPPKASASRFTVCPLWPLGYLAIGPSARRSTFCGGGADPRRPRPSRVRWSWRRDLNPRPAAYKAAALPLSYASKP